MDFTLAPYFFALAEVVARPFLPATTSAVYSSVTIRRPELHFPRLLAESATVAGDDTAAVLLGTFSLACYLGSYWRFPFSMLVGASRPSDFASSCNPRIF